MTSPARSLVNEIREAYHDRDTGVLAIETRLLPAAGTRVSPPTYAAEVEEGSRRPRYAETAYGLIPKLSADGLYSDVGTDENGLSLRRPSVTLNSVPAESGRCETALWENREMLDGLPGFVVSGGDVADSAFGKGEEWFKDAARTAISSARVSSWTAAHRHVDAWIKDAAESEGDDKSLWAKADSRVRDIITNINASQDATLAYQYAPNALIYGFWLSSGAPTRHRHARIYTSSVTGFDAYKSQSFATKMTPADISNAVRVSRGPDNQLTVGGKNKPSDLGYGSVPADGRYTFEPSLILRQASISMTGLRNLRFAGTKPKEKHEKASVVLTLMALLGHVLANADGRLRSGCELIAQGTVAAWKKAGGVTAPLGVDLFHLPYQEQVDLLVEAYRLAVTDAEQVGLSFAEPVDLHLQDQQVKLLAESYVMKKSDKGEA